jgi:hypothetical protein
MAPIDKEDKKDIKQENKPVTIQKKITPWQDMLNSDIMFLNESRQKVLTQIIY